MKVKTKTLIIEEYLLNKNWLNDILSVSFLAAGEYNENYLIQTKSNKYVFRMNHGSQLGLNDTQIEYEYNVLKSIEGSGVTPIGYNYEISPPEFDKGVLLMSYHEGRPLDYSKDIKKAAEIFAKIHYQPTSDKLIVQANPIKDIANESIGMIKRYDHDFYMPVRTMLIKYYEKMLILSDSVEEIFKNENMCIVNTEVNSHNFIIGHDRSILVDWEKAVVSFRYQDLGHFLVPTTTLWKTDHKYSTNDKKEFIGIYKDNIDINISSDELYEKTILLEKIILLRALSWCYMAYYEYSKTDRVIKNKNTFKKIKMYLDEAECFLK